MIKRRKILILAALTAALVGCKTTPVRTTPEHFSTYEETQKSISAEGVVYRQKQLELDQGDIDFWKAALKIRMVEDAGYQFVSEEDLVVDGTPGYLIELQAPIGIEDYRYLIAIFKTDKHLTLIESAGKIEDFLSRRDAIIEAVKGLGFSGSSK